MGRVIKFRAWSPSYRMMFSAEFDPYEFMFSFIDGELSFSSLIGRYGDGGYRIYNMEKENEAIFMQYTGIKDVNGIEIYEGDIILHLDTDWPSNSNDNKPLIQYLREISTKCIIKYNEEYACFEAYYKGIYEDWTSSSSLFVQPFGRLEVIGNIYENQELLNK